MEMLHSAIVKRVRQLRPFLKNRVDQQVQELIDGHVPNPEQTLVSYWIKKGALGENFRRKGIIFECFHNFLAFSQWGTMLYNINYREYHFGVLPDLRNRNGSRWTVIPPLREQDVRREATMENTEHCASPTRCYSPVRM